MYIQEKYYAIIVWKYLKNIRIYSNEGLCFNVSNIIYYNAFIVSIKMKVLFILNNADRSLIEQTWS